MVLSYSCLSFCSRTRMGRKAGHRSLGWESGQAIGRYFYQILQRNERVAVRFKLNFPALGQSWLSFNPKNGAESTGSKFGLWKWLGTFPKFCSEIKLVRLNWNNIFQHQEGVSFHLSPKVGQKVALCNFGAENGEAASLLKFFRDMKGLWPNWNMISQSQDSLNFCLITGIG